jgi:hypothetical protein
MDAKGVHTVVVKPYIVSFLFCFIDREEALEAASSPFSFFKVKNWVYNNISSI